MTVTTLLPSKLGFGAAPLGKMFRDIPQQEALATVEAAWDDVIPGDFWRELRQAGLAHPAAPPAVRRMTRGQQSQKAARL